jgi:hypothetical protein
MATVKGDSPAADPQAPPAPPARRWMVVWPSWSVYLTVDGSAKGEARTEPVTTIDGRTVVIGDGGWATFLPGSVIDPSIGCSTEHLDLMTSLGALRGAPSP